MSQASPSVNLIRSASPSVIRKEIPCEGFILLVCGPKVLRDGLNVCKKLKLKPFLIWGTLLGFAREAGFIKHDPDIDIGLLKRDFIRKNQLKQAMITKGYKFIYEDEDELLFTHIFKGLP